MMAAGKVPASQGEDAARGDEEIHADHGDGRGQGRPGLDGAQRGGVGKPHPCLGGDAAEGVHAGSHRPDADGPQITFLVPIQSMKRPAKSMQTA